MMDRIRRYLRRLELSKSIERMQGEIEQMERIPPKYRLPVFALEYTRLRAELEDAAQELEIGRSR